MPKFQSPNSDTTSKNPYITKTISKSLLTPCRQMGLSRKRKTPSSASRSDPPSSSNSDATPPSQERIAEPVENARNKKTVSKCLIPKSPVQKDSKGIANETVKPTTKLNTSAGKAANKQPTECAKKSPKKVVETACLKNQSPTRILHDKNVKSPEMNVPKSPITTKNVDVEEATPVKKENAAVKEKSSKIAKVKTAKSSKKTVSVQETTKSPVKCLKESPKQDVVKEKSSYIPEEKTSKSPKKTVPLQETTKSHVKLLKDSSIKDKEEELGEVKPKPKNWRRSLSLKKTLNDHDEDSPKTKKLKLKDCTVQNQKSDGMDVNALQKVLAEREKLLQDMRQVELYQKQHNLKEIKETTQVWKRGCIRALNDLLALVKTRVDTDMPTLLEKLQVPPGLLTLTPDGELI